MYYQDELFSAESFKQLLELYKISEPLLIFCNMFVNQILAFVIYEIISFIVMDRFFSHCVGIIFSVKERYNFF